MKALKKIYLFLFAGLLVISCQKDSLDPVQEIQKPGSEFEVPTVPNDIANMMSDGDLAKFQAGPGEEYLQMIKRSNARRARGNWYPVLMNLGYHLQISPIGGTSCLPGDFVPCFGPGAPADPTECLANIVGATGMTLADGYWFGKQVHSEYYPVFCGADYSGYGQGFYQLDNGLLWLEAENGPFQFDEAGNATFCRKGKYVPEQSNGIFAGALGWEVMVSHTAAVDSPTDDGIGYSNVIIFGWVFR